MTFAEFAFAVILPEASDDAPLDLHMFLIASECSPEVPATALLLQNFCGLQNVRRVLLCFFVQF